MRFTSIQNIYLSFIALVIIFSPIKTLDALSPDWISVPKSQYGEQLWDQNSVQKNQDGSIRVFSKFIPKNTTGITQEIPSGMLQSVQRNGMSSKTRIQNGKIPMVTNLFRV